MKTVGHKTWKHLGIALTVLFHASVFLSLSFFKLNEPQPIIPGFFEMGTTEGSGDIPGGLSSLKSSGNFSKLSQKAKPQNTSFTENKKDKILSSETGEPELSGDSIIQTDESYSDTLSYGDFLYSIQGDGGYGDGQGNGSGSGMQMPIFMDGDYNNFKDWVVNNYNLQSEYYKGNVIVQFIVNSTGNISDVKIFNCTNKKVKAEIERVMNMSPRWIPAKQRNRPVNILFKLPINFNGY